MSPHYISPHFTEEEFACRCGCRRFAIDFDLILRLEKARDIAGISFVVRSGCRCPSWNIHENGKPNSAHLTDVDNGERCQAVDIATVTDRGRYSVINGLLAAGFSRIGIGAGYVHTDIDPKKPPYVMFLEA